MRWLARFLNPRKYFGHYFFLVLGHERGLSLVCIHTCASWKHISWHWGSLPFSDLLAAKIPKDVKKIFKDILLTEE
jgi:hypothetical protein